MTIATRDLRRDGLTTPPSDQASDQGDAYVRTDQRPGVTGNCRIPFEEEKERLVLGAMLRDESLIPRVRDKLAPDDFFDESNGAIAAALYVMAQGGDVPAVKLKHELISRGQFERVGGQEYLVRLLCDYPDLANAEYNAAAVHRASVLRQLRSLGSAMEVAAGRATADDADDLIGQFADKLSALAGGGVDNE